MLLSPSLIKTKLFQVISNAEKHVHDFVHNPGRDMTRHRDCTNNLTKRPQDIEKMDYMQYDNRI